jgi:MarR family 2-MHQ and catechol resistance regulon transcriptional repressor
MGQESAVHTWLVLSKASRAIERVALQSIADSGLGLSDFAVLELLLHKGSQPVNTIGRKVLLASGSMTAAVDRLEERGLVSRTVSPDDHRARIVELTSAGKKLISEAFAKHAVDMEKTMSILKCAEQNELVRLLKKVGLWAEAQL